MITGSRNNSITPAFSAASFRLYHAGRLAFRLMPLYPELVDEMIDQAGYQVSPPPRGRMSCWWPALLVHQMKLPAVDPHVRQKNFPPPRS